jgi:hypothetical protein
MRKARDWKEVEERFWAKVDKNGPIVPGMQTSCWIWTGASDQNGYGSLRINNKTHKAHRIGWKIQCGSAPIQFVLHKCDNPPCIRIDHLFEGSNSDNQRDAFAKGRMNFQRQPELRPRGEHHASAKLTAEAVAAIKRRYVFRKITQIQLATEFGCTRSNVSRILRGKSWRTHVPDRRSSRGNDGTDKGRGAR